MRLGDLKAGDKFRFYNSHPNYNNGRPYLIINFNFKQISRFTDYSLLVPTLDLVTYRIVGFNKEFEVEQCMDNIPV